MQKSICATMLGFPKVLSLVGLFGDLRCNDRSQPVLLLLLLLLEVLLLLLLVVLLLLLLLVVL